MEVIWFEKIDMADYEIKTSCDVYGVHIKVSDIDTRADEMIETLANTDWINPLPATKKVTFKATSKRTIVKLSENIRNRINEDKLTEDFGEYLVSDTALKTLEKIYNHIRVPLAELLKEKLTGNPGFDFHSETETKFISFGEAKYSGNSSPYNKALKQIKDFISLEKDNAEINVLENFVSESATTNFLAGDKAFSAAFSLNDDPKKMIKNALLNKHLKQLLGHKELYLIGVEIDDPGID